MTRGAKYVVFTVAVASGPVIPPTSTMPIVTPSAIVGGVSAPATFALPTRAQTAAMQRMDPARLTVSFQREWDPTAREVYPRDRASKPPNRYDGYVVGQVPARELPRILGDRRGEGPRRQVAVRREQRVEPLVAVELAVAPRFDDAVGEEDERRAGRQLDPSLRILLPRLD